MRNLLSTVLLLAATLAASAQNDLKSVLSQLDATLSHRDSYIAGREQRIESLKNILRKSDFSDAQRYILNQQLIDEYTPYQADSTIDYLYRNIALATRMNDAGHLNESRIQLAYLYSSAGIYLEAANMLKLVDTTALDRRAAGRLLHRPPQTQRRTPALLPRLGAGTRIVAAYGDLRPADRGEHRTGVGHAPQLPAPPGDRRPRLPAGRGDFRTAVQHPATPFARICRGVVHARPRGGPDGRHAHGAGVVRTLGDDRHPAGRSATTPH